MLLQSILLVKILPLYFEPMSGSSNGKRIEIQVTIYPVGCLSLRHRTESRPLFLFLPPFTATSTGEFPLSSFHALTHSSPFPSAQVWESVPQSRRRRRRPSNEAPSASVRVECERTLSPLFPPPLLHSSVRPTVGAKS